MMKSYKYLIIGGGMTADAAVNGIRELDKEGSIGMISKESDPPYNRPPLSKGLWKGKSLESIWRKTKDKNVELNLESEIVSLKPDKLIALDALGNEYHGEKILLATGGTPRRLPFGGENIIYYRTLEDYRHLFKLSQENQEFTMIGGGFIGAEVAAALAMNGKKVTMVFPEEGIGGRIYPREISQFLNDFYRNKDIEVLTGEQVVDFLSQNNRFILKTLSGREIISDVVIAGIGIEPNVELAKASGMQVEKGIIVNEFLETSRANIYAAGDVAEFFNPALGKRIRLEHEDNANTMGRFSGRNMAGASEPYDHLPYFYSDLFELGYEAVGELDPRLQIVVDWAEPYKKGVIYYFKENRICGVLLWNVWDKIPDARALIAQPGPFNLEDLKGKNPPSWKIKY
jgi:3-phenylpropionate/trans-cinnamate dioxygenase ferredoxin reductase component